MQAWWDGELSVRDCLSINEAFKSLHEEGKVIKGIDYMEGVNNKNLLKHLQKMNKESNNERFNEFFDKKQRKYKDVLKVVHTLSMEKPHTNKCCMNMLKEA